MTAIQILERKALLHRQAADFLREEAERHETDATAIDGQISSFEKKDLARSLENLTYRIENTTLKSKLARMEA